jgi:hypothetical protein
MKIKNLSFPVIFIVFSVLLLPSCSQLWTNLHNPVDPDNCNVNIFLYTWPFYDPLQSLFSEPGQDSVQILAAGVFNGTQDAVYQSPDGKLEFYIYFSGSFSTMSYYDAATSTYLDPVVGSVTITGPNGPAVVPVNSCQYSNSSYSVNNVTYFHTVALLHTGLTATSGDIYTLTVSNAHITSYSGTALDRSYTFSGLTVPPSVPGLTDGLTTQLSQSFSSSAPWWEWSAGYGSGKIDTTNGVFIMSGACTKEQWGYDGATGYYKRYPFALPTSGAFAVSADIVLEPPNSEAGLYLSDSAGKRIALLRITASGTVTTPSASAQVLSVYSDGFAERKYTNANTYGIVNSTGFRRQGNTLYAYLNGTCIDAFPVPDYAVNNAGLFVSKDINWSNTAETSTATFDNFTISY